MVTECQESLAMILAYWENSMMLKSYLDLNPMDTWHYYVWVFKRVRHYLLDLMVDCKYHHNILCGSLVKDCSFFIESMCGWGIMPLFPCVSLDDIPLITFENLKGGLLKGSNWIWQLWWEIFVIAQTGVIDDVSELHKLVAEYAARTGKREWAKMSTLSDSCVIIFCICMTCFPLNRRESYKDTTHYTPPALYISWRANEAKPKLRRCDAVTSI